MNTNYTSFKRRKKIIVTEHIWGISKKFDKNNNNNNNEEEEETGIIFVVV